MLGKRTGKPYMFFLCPENTRRHPTNAIDELEKDLTAIAGNSNPDLENLHGKERPKWAIAGVVRGGKGNSAASAKDFKKMMQM